MATISPGNQSFVIDDLEENDIIKVLVNGNEISTIRAPFKSKLSLYLNRVRDGWVNQ